MSGVNCHSEILQHKCSNFCKITKIREHNGRGRCTIAGSATSKNLYYKMAKKTITADRLDMRQIQLLQRINKQSLAKSKFHQERNLHMQSIINRQKAATYESELARLENARIKGPLSQESYNRMMELKAIIK